MAKIECASCLKTNATLKCGLCHCDLCKSCAQFLDKADFSFLTKIPLELTQTTYCNNCYLEKVAPHVETYNKTMELAKQIIVFDKSQGKESRLYKRHEKPIKVVDCPDREETVLRLAFMAVQAKYNAIIDLELRHRIVRNGSYKSTVWTGTAIPTHAQERR